MIEESAAQIIDRLLEESELSAVPQAPLREVIIEDPILFQVPINEVPVQNDALNIFSEPSETASFVPVVSRFQPEIPVLPEEQLLAVLSQVLSEAKEDEAKKSERDASFVLDIRPIQPELDEFGLPFLTEHQIAAVQFEQALGNIPVDEPSSAQDLAEAANFEVRLERLRRDDPGEGIFAHQDDEKVATDFDIPQDVARPETVEHRISEFEALNVEALLGQSALGRAANVKTIIPSGLQSLRAIQEDINDRNLELYETKDFNTETIKRIVLDNLRADGHIQDDNSLTFDLQLALEEVFKQTLSSDDPSINTKRAISTLATGLHRSVAEPDSVNIISADRVNQLALVALKRLISPEGLQSLETFSPDASQLLAMAAFRPEIESMLDTKNLTVSEIDRISKEYLKAMFQFVEASKDGKIANINNALGLFEGYIRDNIANDQLKQILLQETQGVRQTLQTMAFQQTGIHSRSVVPISLNKGFKISPPLMQDSIGETLDRVINNAIDIVEEKQLTSSIGENVLAEDQKIEHPEQPSIRQTDARLLKAQLVSLAEDINELAKRTGINFSLPGEPIQPLRIQTTNADGSSKTLFQILEGLQKLNNIIKLQTSAFFRSPQPSHEEANDTNEQAFIRELRSLTEKSSTTKQRHLTTKIPHATGLKKLGKIKIWSTEGESKKELDIPSDARVEDLLKLAAILTMEPGILEDIDGNRLMKIQKNQSNVQVIVDLIIQELHKNLGHGVKLLYIPESPVGGQFLDGFFSVLHVKPLAPRSIGGGFDSSGLFRENPLSSLAEMPISIFTPFKYL